MKRTALTIAFTLAVTTASAATMRTTGLTVASEELADDMALYSGLAQVCRSASQPSLNRAYWERKIKQIVSENEYKLFAKIVRLRANLTVKQMSRPDAPLLCDDSVGHENDVSAGTFISLDSY